MKPDPEIILIGPYPPLLGGISTHLLRLKAFLEENGLTVRVFDYSKGRPEKGLARLIGIIRSLFSLLRVIWAPWPKGRARIIHFHISAGERYLPFGVALHLVTPGRLKVLTVHSGRIVEQIVRMDLKRKKLLSRLISGFDKVILVSEEQRLIFENVLGISPGRIDVIPAFLPPAIIRDEWGKGGRELPLIAACGYLNRIYGYEVLLDAIELLYEQGCRFRTELVFYTGFEESYAKGIRKRAEELGVKVLDPVPPDEFISFLSSAHIFVRPTLVDGDSNALREAHWAGVHVVASDCVRRPRWAYVFRTGDPRSLASRLARLLDTPRPVFPVTDDGGGGERILNLYRKLVCDSARGGLRLRGIFHLSATARKPG